MFLLATAIVILQAPAGPISVRTRIIRLDDSAKVSGKGFDVVHRSPANFGVGLELAVDGIVDDLLKKHQAQMIYDKSMKALIGERMLWSFNMSSAAGDAKFGAGLFGGNNSVRLSASGWGELRRDGVDNSQNLAYLFSAGPSTASATADGCALDMSWNYAGRGGVLSHHFVLPKGDGAVVVVRVGMSRLLLAINVSDAVSN